jgi:hypothetical protein
MRRFIVLLLALGLFLAWNTPGGCPAASVLDNCFLARAQSAGQAEADLYPADASTFPTISSFLDVFDATGRFVSGLKPEQVMVSEDGQPLPLSSLTEMVVPLQLAVVLNPSPALGIHDKSGAPRFEGIQNALTAWAQKLPPDAPDDMSFVSISGPIIAHASARDWLVSLSAFHPDFKATTPNLQSLQIGIQTVAVQPPRVGMKRAVFFITPHMDDPNIDTQVQALIQSAIVNRVRVFVWFTDTDLYAATASAAAFNALAVQTGGAFFSGSDTTPFPDPESYFAPLRRLYAFQYESAVKTGGSHTISVQVQGPAGAIQSVPESFKVDLQPPNPILVSPPLEVVRGPPPGDPYNEKVLQPAQQRIDIIVEFPDGHKRPLVRTTLYVDGQIAAENKAPPFDSFNWDLSGYRLSGEHKIVVEAVDALNLSKSSLEMPITVTVIQPPHGLSAIFGRYQQYITVGAVALAGLVLLLILFLGRLGAVFSGSRSSRQAQADPLTQSVTAGSQATVPMTARTTQRTRAVTRKSARVATDAPAYLRRLQADPLAAPGQTFKPVPGSPILLVAKETTFGSDPAQSSYVLDDPSLEPRHARITQTDNHDFFIVDAGTIGGTWVNFEPVGPEAQLLQHGDVIHFGQLVFRFELKEPPAPAQPKISKVPPHA